MADEQVKIEKEIGPAEEANEEVQAEEKPLTVEQAFQNVDVACAQFSGNRAQHQLLVKSLGLLSAVVNEFKALKTSEVESEEE